LQTGRTEEAQVIPETLLLNLMIVLGTLAPKTNLRQMGPDGGLAKQTCARWARWKAHLVPD